MIDETSVVTYHSENAPREELTWMAQVVLSNGKFWGMYFIGKTEQEAVDKAVNQWNNIYKDIKDFEKVENEMIEKPSGRGHHLAGKVWMIHKTTREKVRIDPDQVIEYEFKGYEKGGPRSK